jgi:hypothetical protein
MSDTDFQFAQAPYKWTAKQVVKAIQSDPMQTRVSMNPVFVRHPTLHKTKPLAEYVEEFVTAPRFAIETDDAFVFISRLQNSSVGTIFKAVAVVPKSAASTQKGEKRLSNLILPVTKS